MSTMLHWMETGRTSVSFAEKRPTAGALPPPRLPRPVRGVLFDFGGVLYDDTVWRRWLLRLLSHVGLHTHYSSFYYVWDRDFAADVYRGRRTFDDAFAAYLRSAGLPCGLIDEVMAACRGLRRELDASLRPLPGVRCTLARLVKLGMRLGVLSDSELAGDELQARLAGFAPVQAFQVVVSSIDLGCTKPEPVCYREAVMQMGLSPHEVAFVGHDQVELAGAQAVGMPTIALSGSPDAEADVYLDRFEQLADAVGLPQRLAVAG